MIIALALTIACIATGDIVLVIAGKAILADVSPRVANVDVVVGGDKFEICGLVLLYAILPFGAKKGILAGRTAFLKRYQIYTGF